MSATDLLLCRRLKATRFHQRHLYMRHVVTCLAPLFPLKWIIMLGRCFVTSTKFEKLKSTCIRWWSDARCVWETQQIQRKDTCWYTKWQIQLNVFSVTAASTRFLVFNKARYKNLFCYVDVWLTSVLPSAQIFNLNINLSMFRGRV